MDYVAENAAARDRILSLVRDLTDDAFLKPTVQDWTISATLAHLAFWDRVHVGRLSRALAEGLMAPPPLPDGLTDIINDGELPAWRRIPGRAAVQLFEAASHDVDDYLRTLPDRATVEAVRIAGMPWLIERSRHRTEHGDADRAGAATSCRERDRSRGAEAPRSRRHPSTCPRAGDQNPEGNRVGKGGGHVHGSPSTGRPAERPWAGRPAGALGLGRHCDYSRPPGRRRSDRRRGRVAAGPADDRHR